MKSVQLKATQWFRTALMLLLIPTVLNANDEWLEPNESPVWIAGGTFTAELDLSANELRLFPLIGQEQTISVAVACSNNPELDEGVYLLNLDADKAAFQPSYFQGPSAQSESLPLLRCQSSNNATDKLVHESGIQLSDEALLAIRGFDVGAIYVHN
jgi:hypothetical protein